MLEFVTQHQFGVVLLLALLLLASACAVRYTVHPGALNKTDSAAYDALLIAETAIDQARTEYQTGRLPVGDKDAKAALDALIASYNIARESWLTYRGAITTNVPRQVYLDKLNRNLSDLTNAIRQFEEAK